MAQPAGMALPDWYYPEDDARRKVALWVGRPKVLSILKPIWVLGYLAARSFVTPSWLGLRARIARLAARLIVVRAGETMRVIMAVLLLSLATPAVAQFCDAGSEKSRQEAKQVSLLHPTDGPAYYFRVSHYAFLIPVDQFVAHLEAREWAAGARERLLAEIKKDPVTSRTDLFKYALMDGRNLQLIEHAVADLVEKGKAALVDVWEWTTPDSMVLSVKVVTTIGVCAYRGREFFSPSNDLLLQVTDSIA